MGGDKWRSDKQRSNEQRKDKQLNNSTNMSFFNIRLDILYFQCEHRSDFVGAFQKFFFEFFCFCSQSVAFVDFCQVIQYFWLVTFS